MDQPQYPVIPGVPPMGIPAGAPVVTPDMTALINQQMQASAAPAGAPDLRSFDISAVKPGRNFEELLPEGLRLEGVITGAKLDQNQNSGKWAVKFVLEVDFPAAAVGISVWGQATITTDNPFIYASLIRATDLEANGRFVGASVESFNGRRVSWVNKVDEYNGKRSNKHGAFNHAKEQSCAIPGRQVTAPQAAPVQMPLPQGYAPATGQPIYPGQLQVAGYPVPAQQVVPNPHIPQAAPAVVPTHNAAPVAPAAPAPNPAADPAYQAYLAAQQAAAAAAAAGQVLPVGEPDWTQRPPQV